MKNNELANLLLYSNDRTIYVVDKNNRIRKLHVPFKVVVIKKVGKLRLYSIQCVQRIKCTKTFTTVYQIGNKNYYYWYFNILI